MHPTDDASKHPPDPPARVLVVDDHAVFRSRVRALVESAGYEVVGEAEDASRAIAETHRLRPDVVLLDVQLPDRDGFSVASEISALPSAPQIVLISSREAADYGRRLSALRPINFIHKSDLSRARLEEIVGSPRGP